MAQALLIRQNNNWTFAQMRILYQTIRTMLSNGGLTQEEIAALPFDYSAVLGTPVTPTFVIESDTFDPNKPTAGGQLQTTSRPVKGVEEYGPVRQMIGVQDAWSNSTANLYFASQVGMSFPAVNQDDYAFNGVSGNDKFLYRSYLDIYCKSVLVVISENGFFICADNGNGGKVIGANGATTRGYCWHACLGGKHLLSPDDAKNPDMSKGPLLWTNGWHVWSPIQDPSVSNSTLGPAYKYPGMVRGYSFSRLTDIAQGDYLTRTKANVNRRLALGSDSMILQDYKVQTIWGTTHTRQDGVVATFDDPSSAYRPFGTVKKADGSDHEALSQIIVSGATASDDHVELSSLSGDFRILGAMAPLSKGVPFSIQTIAEEQVILIPNRQSQVSADRDKTFLAIKVM